MDYDILDLDSKIRLVGVCADSGETRYGYQREGVKNLLSHDESKKSNLQAMTRWGYVIRLLPRFARADTQWQRMNKSNG